jgi:lysophospholipase L1-like esterase
MNSLPPRSGTGGEYDGVIDFDAAVRDPSQAGRMLPAYDSGDHLHPNDAGYQAMANSIDLPLFTRG